MIPSFLENCEKNSAKRAICYQKGRKTVVRTYGRLRADMLKAVELLLKNNVDSTKRALLFVEPSYDFYVTVLAAIFLNVEIVIIDSYRSQDVVHSYLQVCTPDVLLCSRLTEKICPFIRPLRRLNRVNVSDYRRYTAYSGGYEQKDKAILTTFTSGTTGVPKMIHRNLADLKKQFELIVKLFPVSDVTVLCMLPVYELFCLYRGYETVLAGKRGLARLIEGAQPNAVMGSVSKLLRIPQPLPGVLHGYTGGAILHRDEAQRLRSLFPNASIDYVYGASEAVIISKTDLAAYQAGLESGELCLGEIPPDLDVEIHSPNAEGVGEIVVRGDYVLQEGGVHYTGDLGRLKDGKLYLFGRKKYSRPEDRFYNYIVDEYELFEKGVCGFSFAYREEKYIVYSGKCPPELPGYRIVKLRRLPLDLKHRTKLNYARAIGLILKKEKITRK